MKEDQGRQGLVFQRELKKERKKDSVPIAKSQMVVRVTDLEIISKMWRFLFFS